MTSVETYKDANEAVKDVFSVGRLQKMHKLAKSHQSALTASDIMSLRSKGVVFNKGLIGEYDRHVSQQEMQSKDSEHFLKWLNNKTSPSMAEAPTMCVFDLTPANQPKQKVEVRAFGPGGDHYEMSTIDTSTAEPKPSIRSPATKAVPKDSKPLHADTVQEDHVNVINEAATQLMDSKRELHKIIHHLNMTGASAELQGAAKHVKMVCDELMALREKNDEAAARLRSTGCKTPTDENEEFHQDDHVDIINAAADKLLELKRELHDTKEELKAHNSAENAAMVNEAADQLMHYKNELEVLDGKMTQITKHLQKSSNKKGKIKCAVTAVKEMCGELREQQEVNEALMNQSVRDASNVDDCVSDAKVMERAHATLKVLNEQKMDLEAQVCNLTNENNVFARDLEDMKESVEHYKDTVNTLMRSNMKTKKEASMNKHHGETHANMVAALNQKLAATLHYNATDEDGCGNAKVYLKAVKDGCDCGEFDDAASRNEERGCLLMGSTPLMLTECEIGSRTKMRVDHSCGLTKNGHLLNEVCIERLDNAEDGTVMGQLQETIHMGEHSIQRKVCMTSNNYYELKLNAK